MKALLMSKKVPDRETMMGIFSDADTGSTLMGPPMNKRSRIDDANYEIENRLETLITRLGDSTAEDHSKSLQEHMNTLNKHLDDLAQLLESDLNDHKNFILRILVLCAYQLPHKCAVYTTLVGLINVKNYNAGSELVELLIKELEEMIHTEQWDSARWIVRFICDLVNSNVVSPQSVIMFLESLLDVVQEDGYHWVRKDYYALCVLSALPWCGQELYNRNDTRPEFEEILAVLEQYVDSDERKRQMHKWRELLGVWKVDSPHLQEEQLHLLMQQINTMRNNSWQERFLLRPYLAFKEALEDALQHDIPPFEPPVDSVTTNYPIPKIQLRMFDLNDVPDPNGPILPGPRSIERYIIDEQLEQIMTAFEKDRKSCAEKLLNLPGGNRIPIQTMIVEMLFSLMYKLPQAAHVEAAYLNF